MTVFIVATIKKDVDAVLKSRITEQFPADHYEIGRGQWLVAFGGTARELFLKLSPEHAQSETSGLQSIVVFGIGGYWGVASPDMWEWITTRLRG